MGIFKRRPTGEYRGRLECNSDVSLAAGEGPWKGRPVFHNLETGLFEFVRDGAPTHNQLHHSQHVQMNGTTELDAHHNVPTVDDAHNDPSAPAHTAIKFDPDHVAVTATGHTDAYVAKEDA